MNFLGFLGMIASVGNFLSFISSPIGVGNLPQPSSSEGSRIQNSLAIASRPLHPAKFATLTKLPRFAGKRYILAAIPQVGFTPRDGWQTLLEGFARPQFAVQATGQKFQIQVKGHVVAEVTSQDQADLIIWQLQQMVLNPDFDPKSLHPGLGLRHGMINAAPVGKVKNEVLFWIDRPPTPQIQAPQIQALQIQENSELKAIAWINNLRAALNVPKLSLAEAQSQMHELVPTDQHLKGTASWYGPYFHGRQTATGEIFNQNDLTAAHPSLPFGTYLKVTNLLTGKRVIVRINDRGPYWGDRSLDLSRQAALCLNSESRGVVPYEAIVMQSVQTLRSAASVPHIQRIGQKVVGQKVVSQGLADQQLAKLIQPTSTQSGQ
jgi:rare lipoprotein A (peptidoglycan hydrolase)